MFKCSTYEVCQKKNGTLYIVKARFTIKKKVLVYLVIWSLTSKKLQFQLFTVIMRFLMCFCLQVLFDKQSCTLLQNCVLMSIEQQANLKFLVQLDKTPSEALTLLQQVYGEDAMSCSRVFEWHKQFKEGHEDLKNNAKSGRPSTSRNVEHVRQMTCSDCQLTI